MHKHGAGETKRLPGLVPQDDVTISWAESEHGDDAVTDGLPSVFVSDDPDQGELWEDDFFKEELVVVEGDGRGRGQGWGGGGGEPGAEFFADRVRGQAVHFCI